MKYSKRRLVARLIIPLLGGIVIASGVTFAAMRSQPAVLTGNSITTATANLKLSVDSMNFLNTVNGFSFAGVVPGGAAVPQYGCLVYLRNAGNAPLTLKMSIRGTPANPDQTDLSKVQLLVTANNDTVPQAVSLQALLDASAAGGVTLASPAKLGINSTTVLTLQIKMDGDAVSGTGAAIDNLDLSFSGEATN